VAKPRRDDFPNNYVGDLVETPRGWVVVPPTACPDGHDSSDGGWSVSSVWCTCNGRHMAWRCSCGNFIYAPQPGVECRIREVSPLVLLLPAETSSVTAKGDRYVAERIWSWARGEVMLDDVGPSRNLQFMQDSLPLVDWPKYAEELAEKVRELRHGDD
jgi:hypothetical protein